MVMVVPRKPVVKETSCQVYEKFTEDKHVES